MKSDVFVHCTFFARQLSRMRASLSSGRETHTLMHDPSALATPGFVNTAVLVREGYQ